MLTSSKQVNGVSFEGPSVYGRLYLVMVDFSPRINNGEKGVIEVYVIPNGTHMMRAFTLKTFFCMILMVSSSVMKMFYLMNL